jgi:hypothetical protein
MIEITCLPGHETKKVFDPIVENDFFVRRVKYHLLDIRRYTQQQPKKKGGGIDTKISFTSG